MKAPSERAVRIDVVVATEARVAAIFRRGPTKQVELLRWDLATDEVQRGQWLAGQVYTEKCGLSPDGRLLVYFAAKFRGPFPTYTVVSRPPWFTALALWPDNATWGGGGFFESNTSLLLNYNAPPKPLESLPLPRNFSVRGRSGGERNPTGWTLQQQGGDGRERTEEMRVVFSPPWQYTKPNPLDRARILCCDHLGMFEVNGPSRVKSYRVTEGKTETDLGRLDWADWDHEGALLFARDGRLFRKKFNGDEREVADLRKHAFRSIVSPREARIWPR